VAVRCCFCHQLRAERTTGSRPIVDHDRLSNADCQLVGQQPRELVGCTTSRVGDDQLDGSIGVSLCAHVQRANGGQHEEHDGAVQAIHVCSSQAVTWLQRNVSPGGSVVSIAASCGCSPI